MNKSLLIAVVVTAALLLAIPGLTDDSDGVITGDVINDVVYVYYTYDDASGQLIEHEAQMDNCIQLTSGTYTDNEVLTGNYVVTESIVVNGPGPFHISGEVNIIIEDGCTFEFNRRFVVNDGSTLNIFGTGAGTGTLKCLNITGDEKGTSTINIYGATVVAHAQNDMTNGGSYGSAAIGALHQGGSVNINLYNADIDAVSYNAAGIGGGHLTNGETTVNIYGGDIKARSTGGAGIGGGVSSGKVTVTLHDATVSNAESVYGSGIGGGMGSSCDVEIIGGNITATSGEGSGIGASNGGSSNITISGDSAVTATSVGGTAIGGSNESLDVSIDIESGKVTANGVFGKVGKEGEQASNIDVTVSGGYVYAKNVVVHELTVSGGAALFYVDSAFSVTNNHTDIGEAVGHMAIYDLSQSQEHLQLYYDAYTQGYTNAIDHVHNQNGDSHALPYEHNHCDVKRYDGTRCGYSEVSDHVYGPYQYRDGMDQHYQVCVLCGSERLSDHRYTSATEIDDEVHEFTCLDCHATVRGPHDIDSEEVAGGLHHRFCKTCTYSQTSQHQMTFYPIDGDTEMHMGFCDECDTLKPYPHNIVWTDNGDGTHSGECVDCHTPIPSRPHEYVNGVCECGAIDPVLIGSGGMDDVIPPVWGYDDHAQDVYGTEDEEWIAIAVAATAATIMAVFLIWDRRR